MLPNSQTNLNRWHRFQLRGTLEGKPRREGRMKVVEQALSAEQSVEVNSTRPSTTITIPKVHRINLEILGQEVSLHARL